jgi:hypothetical protein
MEAVVRQIEYVVQVVAIQLLQQRPHVVTLDILRVGPKLEVCCPQSNG